MPGPDRALKTEDRLTRARAKKDARWPELSLVLPNHDVRRKRPPALSFLLSIETLRRVGRVASLLILDYIGVFGAIYTAELLRVPAGEQAVSRLAYHETAKVVSFAYLVTVLLFARADLYAERNRRPGMTHIVSALFQAAAVALVFAVANGERFSSYFLFYGSLAFAVGYIGVMRYAHTKLTGLLLRRAGYRRRGILVGTGRHIEEVAHALTDAAAPRLEVIGFISLIPRPQNGLRSLGRLQDLSKILSEHRVQDVVIADHDFPQDRAVELVDVCHQRGVSVHVAPSTMEILMGRAEFVPGQSVPLFTLKPPVFDGFDFFLKRSFDLAVSLVLLVLLAPVLAVIAFAVALSSRGPVFYRSLRPGMGGTPFGCLKFRTMRSDADQRQADLESLNEASGPLFKIRHDPRLTRVGGFLRRFSLDELPQLWNVLRGQMSLVGPRPLPLRDFERLEDWHKKRYLVMPGITGLWQVSGRSDLDFDDLVRLDFLYLERWSVFLDLVILLKTVPAVLGRRGAY